MSVDKILINGREIFPIIAYDSEGNVMTKPVPVLNRKRRNEMYKLALEKLQTTRFEALCAALFYSLLDLNYHPSIINNYFDPFKRKFGSEFPELDKHRPKDYVYYWFPLDYKGMQKRVAILKQCIIETSDLEDMLSDDNIDPTLDELYEAYFEDNQ